MDRLQKLSSPELIKIIKSLIQDIMFYNEEKGIKLYCEYAEYNDPEIARIIIDSADYDFYDIIYERIAFFTEKLGVEYIKRKLDFDYLIKEGQSLKTEKIFIVFSKCLAI